MHKTLVCMCNLNCFPNVYVPDACSAMAVINRTGCSNARYEMTGDHISSAIKIKKGVFIAQLGFTCTAAIDTAVVDMYLFWRVEFGKWQYAQPSDYGLLAGLFEIATGRIHFNGEDIRPYCDFTVTENGNIWFEKYKCGVDYDRFVALSAAVNSDALMY